MPTTFIVLDRFVQLGGVKAFRETDEGQTFDATVEEMLAGEFAAPRAVLEIAFEPSDEIGACRNASRDIAVAVIGRALERGAVVPAAAVRFCERYDLSVPSWINGESPQCQ